MGLLNKIFRNTPKGYTRINIKDFLDSHMKGGAIPVDVFIELQNLLLSGERYAVLQDNVISSIEETLLLKKEEERAIYECAELNNCGIEQEKSGNIAAAISTYEKNLTLNSPATHSYERLMVLYRKQKEYDKEISVIEKAINVFRNENERRAKDAIKECPSKTEEIKIALSTCMKVYGDRISTFTGKPMICFNPYDINKYKKRLEKAKLLKLKSENQ